MERLNKYLPTFTSVTLLFRKDKRQRSSRLFTHFYRYRNGSRTPTLHRYMFFFNLTQTQPPPISPFLPSLIWRVCIAAWESEVGRWKDACRSFPRPGLVHAYYARRCQTALRAPRGPSKGGRVEDEVGGASERNGHGTVMIVVPHKDSSCFEFEGFKAGGRIRQDTLGML